MKLYYAHCIALYDSEIEKEDIAMLENMGFMVYNPNRPGSDQAYREHGMQWFFERVQECDGVAFRANWNGAIPAGVYSEIIVNGKRPLIELPRAIESRGMTVDDTRVYLHEVGQR